MRLGITCAKYVSNTSSEQFLFVLRMYSYLGIVSDLLLRELKVLTQKKSCSTKQGSLKDLAEVESLADVAEIVPPDMAVFLSLRTLEIKLLESVLGKVASEGPPLVHILSRDIDLNVTHQTLAAAAVISLTLCWRDIRIDCVETELCIPPGHKSHTGIVLSRMSGLRDSSDPFPRASPMSYPSVDSSDSCGDVQMQSVPLNLSPLAGRSSLCRQRMPEMRTVFWIGEERGSMVPTARGELQRVKRLPFLDINVKNVIPLKEQDAECHSLRIVAKVGGVRLGGGMKYNEALLHRFGVFDADGGPGPEVEKLIKCLSRSPLANLLRPDTKAGREGTCAFPCLIVQDISKEAV